MVAGVMQVCGVLPDGAVGCSVVVPSALGCRNEIVWERVVDEGGDDGLNALNGTVSQVSLRTLAGDASPCESVQ
jgi:hypothetical protein